jgi:hypothetical protein
MSARICRVLRIPSRGKLLVVIFATLLAHAVEILLYAAAVYCCGISVSTFRSISRRDVTPRSAMATSFRTGDLRLLAGVEALNGCCSSAGPLPILHRHGTLLAGRVQVGMPVIQEIREGRVPVEVYTAEIEAQARSSSSTSRSCRSCITTSRRCPTCTSASARPSAR